jgi:hypothetical protein
MRRLFLALGIPFLAALCAAEEGAVKAVKPAIDQRQPARTETATFALG